MRIGAEEGGWTIALGYWSGWGAEGEYGRPVLANTNASVGVRIVIGYDHLCPIVRHVAVCRVRLVIRDVSKVS